MGLDNGIFIKAKTPAASKLLNEQFEHLKQGTSGEFEFCYWRKCYNIRGRTLEVFSNKYDRDKCEIKFKYKDLSKFNEKVLKYFLDESKWYGSEGSIWEWHIMLPNIGNQIRDITEFLEMVDLEPDIKKKDFEIIFYDSY